MKKSPINVKSLKEQIYDYFIEQFRIDVFKPGSYINLDKTSAELGISQTPLRDAVIQLELEGFVTIEPRRGIYVNAFTLQDMKEYYKVIGALERLAILESAATINEKDIKEMEQVHEKIVQSVQKSNHDLFKDKNFLFHSVYLRATGNAILIKTMNTLKKRLYHFPFRGEKMIPEWAAASIAQHEKLLELMKKGKFTEAADFIQDVHWSFAVQEKFIRMHYTNLKE